VNEITVAEKLGDVVGVIATLEKNDCDVITELTEVITFNGLRSIGELFLRLKVRIENE
jgi:hypothetical protein